MTLSISFEVFPPKTPDGCADLRATAVHLGRVDPRFVSVTYGAGGSDRERTFAAIDAVRESGADVAGHLTCVAQPRSDVDSVIDRYAALGVRHIVALRGDPPAGVGAAYEPHADGYQRTADLVHAIKQRGPFEVAVSAYPEGHPQSPTQDHDLAVLADKVAAGADRAVTQMFFDNAHYLRFRDRVRASGIDVPIVPGIFPIHSFAAVSRFAERCGATIPERLACHFECVEDGSEAARQLAIEVAASQIAELADHGVDHAHIYTMNRADLAIGVCQQLGVDRRVVAA